MPDETVNDDVHTILLDIFASKTHLPIGLFDLRQGKPVFGEESLRHFEPYCCRVQELPGERARCEQDEWQRVRCTRNQGLTLCHAGLYNYALPIFVGHDVVATLLCGEMRILGDEFERKAQIRHTQFVRNRRLPVATAQELRHLYADAKRLPLKRIEREVLTDLHRIENWYYRLTQSQQALTRQTEDVTHELQIYLQGLLGDAEVLSLDLERERSVRREFKDAARDLVQKVLALDVVIQRLGDFLQDYRFEKVRLAKLVHKSRELYESEARERGISVRVELAPLDEGPIEIEASEVHLQHAIHNLVHNAIKYSFAGAHDRSRWVQITGEPVGKCYELLIQNFGVGIDPDEYEKIFEQGYQGRRTQGEYRPGAGHGLTLVKRVVERHHGDISVSSVDQKSAYLTTFTVRLPLIQPREEGQDESANEENRLD